MIMKLRFKTHGRSFSLLEVIIAVAVFFTAVFGILELVSLNMATANFLQKKRPSLGMVAGFTLRDTNIVEDLQEAPEDLGFDYNGGGSEAYFRRAGWERQVTLVAENVEQGDLIASNGVYRVDLQLTEELAKREIISKMSFLMYRPLGLQSP